MPLPKKIDLVVGARPNFVKAAPLLAELERRPEAFAPRLVHTGQHYDPRMSRVFFEDLDLGTPAADLEAGSGSHAQQTARVLEAYERRLVADRPDWVVVFGDVNSTLAGALAACKLGIPVAHVEAGLRSFDRSMPEETNRVVVDHLASSWFATERAAVQNLAAEGLPAPRIFMVGNIMIDSLVRCRDRAARSAVLGRLGVTPGRYILMTVHKPPNVDDHRRLAGWLQLALRLSERLPVVFPCHPRTARELLRAGIEWPPTDRVRKVEPQGYVDFLALEAHCRLAVTDSCGVQEETTVLGVPCLTLAERTDRPVTVEVGTNVLAGTEPIGVLGVADRILAGGVAPRQVPELWDGHTATRIADILAKEP
ncbi:MAG: UDP-N-acetylglucosamine 2-epimerase (non-hydrolyzing) [Deltaproteobacteria bacterium]|nr:UDP-N-acetylglucosamine 2-epimerase (non-hydrolyzing) [Deltaproteobacteria bacterium]